MMECTQGKCSYRGLGGGTLLAQGIDWQNTAQHGGDWKKWCPNNMLYFTFGINYFDEIIMNIHIQLEGTIYGLGSINFLYCRG